MRNMHEPCHVCGYEGPFERGGPGDIRGCDADETECPRCKAQYTLDEDGTVDFMYDLPGHPVAREYWDQSAA